MLQLLAAAIHLLRARGEAPSLAAIYLLRKYLWFGPALQRRLLRNLLQLLPRPRASGPKA